MKQDETIKQKVLFPIGITHDEIKGFFDSIRTLDFYMESPTDTHHVLQVMSEYPDDFVSVGAFIGSWNAGQAAKAVAVSQHMTDEQIFTQYVVGALSGSDAVTVADAIKTADDCLKEHRKRFPVFRNTNNQF